MNRNNIKSGGIYLVDLKGNINPEFGMEHYCILFHTEDRDLYLAFLTTTSPKRRTEKWIYPVSLDNSTVLYRHTRIISKQRVVGERVRSGILSVLDDVEVKGLMEGYTNYINQRQTEALRSVVSYHQNKEKSLKALQLKCVESIEVKIAGEIAYDNLVLSSNGGRVSYTEVSTKKIGEKIIDVILKDKYNQKIVRQVKVNIK